MFGLGEVRVYVLDDLLRRLDKDCERCIYGPAKRRFLTYECGKCIERAEKLVHSIAHDMNFIDNPEKLDKWLGTSVGELQSHDFPNPRNSTR